jgi:hypothetical protein
LEHGADPNQKATGSESPRDLAARAKSKQFLELFTSPPARKNGR